MRRQDSFQRHALVREHSSEQLVHTLSGLIILLSFFWQLAWFITEVVYLARFFPTDCSKDALGALVIGYTVIQGNVILKACFRQADGEGARIASCVTDGVLVPMLFILANLYYWREHCSSHFDSLILAILICHYVDIAWGLSWHLCLRPLVHSILSNRGRAGRGAIASQLALEARLRMWQIGRVDDGLDANSLERIPSMTFSQFSHLHSVIASGCPECAICIESFEANSVVRPLVCKHAFHKDCIDQWLSMHSSCPLCRSRVPTQAAVDEIV